MARRITKHPRLVDRDYEILDHLRRYRMTTREVLHRLFFSDSELNAVTKVTSRLVDHGFLNRYELYSGRSYFVVGPESAKLFGLSPKKCKAIGTQALPREYGILLYCCMASTPRERLLVSELQQKIPNFTGKRSDCGHYYLDHDGENVRLAHIRVDQGGPPDHVVRKCRGLRQRSGSQPDRIRLQAAWHGTRRTHHRRSQPRLAPRRRAMRLHARRHLAP